MKLFILIISALLLLTGCSRRLPPKKASSVKEVDLRKYSTHETPKASKKKSSTKLNQLYSQYRAWKGTPYKYGGLSLKGVDCSGFVLSSYNKVYGIKLPRSTKEQVKKGRIVYLYELKTGDLLFFKTGWNVRHVGIYLENGKFMHASSSKGVVISSVRNGYWKEHYWQTRRLF